MATEFLSPITELFIRVWNFGRKRTGYICNLKEKIDSLEDELGQLKAARDGVKSRVDILEAQSMVRRPEVENWFQRVQVTEGEVNELLQQGKTQLQRRCVSGFCPRNCCSSYKVGKKVVKKLPDVIKLRTEAYGPEQEVADRTTPVEVQWMPDSPEGMEPLRDQALKLLKDDGVSILGIHGMAGVGKTSLLKTINNHFYLMKVSLSSSTTTTTTTTTTSTPPPHRELGWLVIWEVVSKELNLGRLQYKIGRRLGLPFPEKERGHKLNEERKNQIFNILSNKKFLLLLDDCWAEVDLASIGIPVPNHQVVPAASTNSSKSKVVFTTRSEEVCDLMHANKMIIKCLDHSNSRKLFTKNLGGEALALINSDGEAHEFAEDIVKECCGLPQALINVGKTMASKKTKSQWRNARTELKRSRSEFPGVVDKVFVPLKFSYDKLPNETIKSCFIYCSLYSEDFDINKKELIKHWIGEGFLSGFESIDEAYDKGDDIIESLKDVCLLESGDDCDTEVKMHDLIRDLAIWIGRDCGSKPDKFLVQTRANLSQAPPNEKWKEAMRVSLMHNGINSLENEPTECSNLLTLMLNSNWSLCNIVGSFFNSMSTLKVLNLSWTGITELPTSISCLVKLQLLDLSNCGDLRVLPAKLKELKQLKYLDLSLTRSLTEIPLQVMSGLSNLQMLNLYQSACAYPDEGRLVDLEHLTTLGLTVFSINALQQALLHNNRLQACTEHLAIERCSDLHWVKVLQSSAARPSSQENVLLDLGLTKNLKTLCFNDCPLENFEISCVGVDENSGLLSSLDTLIFSSLPLLTITWNQGLSCECFQNLHTLRIGGCNKLKDLAWLLYVPNLKTLHISDCQELQTILGGVAGANDIENMKPFSKLKTLELVLLPKLESICDHALTFPSLKVISVHDCHHQLATKLATLLALNIALFHTSNSNIGGQNT